MKFSKLFYEVERFFEKADKDKKKKEELALSLEKKIESIKKEMKENISEARNAKLKKRLDILTEYQEKL